MNDRQRVFVEEYLQCWNASEAARRAGYNGESDVVGPRLLVNVGIRAAIEKRIAEKSMSADEVLVRLSEHGRADIGQFFKVVEEWTFYPLPSYDIIDAKEVEEPAEEGKEPVKRISYWVRHVVVNVDRLLESPYSRMIAEFKDSPKDGITIKLHDTQGALKLLAQKYGMLKEKIEQTGDVTLRVVYENKRPDNSTADATPEAS